ncbi:sensor domain-containing diguanylate cyclase [Desulfohalovibrio reitneri]|uniref:sensor domain-containing diguanylate cyclase n=1 Tax=Desulfohalovibrio reitneri TaxID=1307759 RepID=UPI0004A6C01A|nr:GGDEF domain-containing protein [Desulfohalovibrio reitneri]
MQRGETPRVMWGLGLDESDERVIADAAGEGYTLRGLPGGRIPESADESEPFLMWVGSGAWRDLPDVERARLEAWEETQRILVLDSEERNLDMEMVMEEGFLTAVRTPLERDDVHDAMHRATEITALYADIFRMTREIFLERELLTRKTDQLLFLNQILSRAAESLDAGTILERAREDMNLLFEVSAVQACFWRVADSESVEAEILLSPLARGSSREEWVEYMLESAGRLATVPVKDFHVELLPGYDEDGAPLPPPRKESTVLLPLRSGYECFGCLALTSPDGIKLAKDQTQTVRAAVNHLALALKNAQLYDQVKHRADYDGLTRIHNRASFDERLVEELKRHQRYNQNLSLLLLDLDHFKRINDDHGHQAGDAVLREIGRLLTNSLRCCDFTARYGGEEFVIILPQTSEADAWVLADRLRQTISRRSFDFEGKSVRVTSSIGVASISPGSLSRVRDLVREADEALYRAKSNGRNTVCLSSGCNETALQQ